MNLNTRCINVVSEAELTNWGLSFGGANATAPGRPDILSDDMDIGDGFGTGASPGPVRRILQSPGYVAFVLGDAPVYRIVPVATRGRARPFMLWKNLLHLIQTRWNTRTPSTIRPSIRGRTRCAMFCAATIPMRERRPFARRIRRIWQTPSPMPAPTSGILCRTAKTVWRRGALDSNNSSVNPSRGAAKGEAAGKFQVKG
jgi:hypothetical protein